MAPHFWGVYEMTESAALGTRSFELSRGTFLFPDGTHVVLPGTAVLESRSFEEEWVAGGKPFTVYLGLKKWNDGAENATAVETLDTLSKVTTRFAAPSDSEPCADLHAGGPRGEVKRLTFVLKIFWETEIDLVGDYLLIPVAQLERTREGIELSRQFILAKQQGTTFCARRRSPSSLRSQRGGGASSPGASSASSWVPTK